MIARTEVRELHLLVRLCPASRWANHDVLLDKLIPGQLNLGFKTLDERMQIGVPDELIKMLAHRVTDDPFDVDELFVVHPFIPLLD